MVEWIEVKGPTVDLAVEVAMSELGITDRELIEVEVLEQPDKGFLGIGRRDAVVRVKKKPARRRRRGRGGREKDGAPRSDGKSTAGSGRRSSSDRREQGGARSKGQPRPRSQGQGRDRNQVARSKDQGRSKGRPADKTGKVEAARARSEAEDSGVEEQPTREVDVQEQADVAREFLLGLLDVFGLEGEVSVRLDDDVILVDINGGQTEALIGDKAAIMYAIHELTRTVVQRKTMANARLRLDIGGYAERRREALGVYATRLAEKVLEDGGEIMLEPMNPADRKVVHDAITDIEGVRTFSEGDEPRRSVVIAPE